MRFLRSQDRNNRSNTNSKMPVRSGAIRVLIAAKHSELRDHIRRLVLDSDGYEIAGAAADGQEATQMAVMLRPDIAILNDDLPIYSNLEVSEMIGLAVPDVSCVLLTGQHQDTELLKSAMRSGARACVSPPYNAQTLMKTVSSLAGIGKKRFTTEYITATDPSRIPKVIVVTGGKGGIGKTTITASLAACLASSNPGKVVIFDLYTQFGDVATMLNITPQRTLTDVVAGGSEIDLELLESCMAVHEPSGVKVLSCATSPQPIDAIAVEHAEVTINALKRGYTYIVVDLPPILHATTLYVLANCYRMFVVTNMFDMPTIRNARELLEKVSGTYLAEDKISVIANRVSKHDRLIIRDLETIIGRPVAATVPNDRRLVVAVNQGVPFMNAYANSPMAEAVKQIANNMICNGAIKND